MQKQSEFTVRVTVKKNRGSFGIKYQHLGEFRFCAKSEHEASMAAAQNVRGRDLDTEVMTQIVWQR